MRRNYSIILRPTEDARTSVRWGIKWPSRSAWFAANRDPENGKHVTPSVSQHFQAMSLPLECPVIIVGSGPVGLSLSILLTKLGTQQAPS